MTDSSGTVVWSADYKPFGEVTVTVSTITNNLRFPGQYYDAETGTLYNYFRDYNPVTGGYLEADRIGLRGGINLYRYVGNNPLYWIDPLGLAGTLTICSNFGSGSSGSLSGHSWIIYTPDGSDVGTTYGTFGNNPNQSGNGLHSNLERDRTGRPASCDASRSQQIDNNQETNLYDLLHAYLNWGDSGWGYFSPCSSFASNAWNAVTGEFLNPNNGLFSNPSTLGNSIVNANNSSN